MKKLLILTLFTFLNYVSFCQSSTPSSVIAFIYSSSAEGQRPLGTGFFVSIPLPTDTSKSLVFLATAKHVLLNPDSTFRKDIHVRLNTHDSSRFIYCPLTSFGKSKNLFISKDSTVDIALFIWPGAKMGDYDFKFLSPETMINRENFKNIQVGNEILFTGLFTPYLGERKNYPIMRFGHIALVTNERINFVGFKRELILIESFTFGGNSGSPVFIRLPNDHLKLIGIMNGYFNTIDPIRIIKADADIPVAISNLGIAAITPSYLLEDILRSEEINLVLKRFK